MSIPPSCSPSCSSMIRASSFESASELSFSAVFCFDGQYRGAGSRSGVPVCGLLGVPGGEVMADVEPRGAELSGGGTLNETFRLLDRLDALEWLSIESTRCRSALLVAVGAPLGTLD